MNLSYPFPARIVAQPIAADTWDQRIASRLRIEVDILNKAVVQCRQAKSWMFNDMNKFAHSSIIILVLLVLVLITKDNLACGRH